MTALKGLATLTFSNGWLGDILEQILAGGTREIKNKARLSEYFIYHQNTGVYLNVAFWPYVDSFNLSLQPVLFTNEITASAAVTSAGSNFTWQSTKSI